MLTLIFVSMFIISFAKGDFDYKFNYCRLRCGCSYSEEKSDEPSDYYWRDFYGIIPPDAFPVGDEHQYPQTYVGLVFDPLNNGTFVTTIVDGLDYVYNAKGGKVFKKTKRIQILCSMEADRLEWLTLTSENLSSVKKEYSFVSAGYHQREQNNNLGYVPTYFVVKLYKCKIGYASSTEYLAGELAFAAMDGTLQKSEQKMFLMYRKNKTESEDKKNKPFISHKYRYSIRGGSIIPNFYKQINIGSCSLICTNEGQDKNSKNKNSVEAANTMEYYWKPSKLIKPDEPINVENKTQSKGNYVAQGFISLNWFDVGESTGTSVSISTNNGAVTQSTDVHVLCSNHKEKFEWVNTTSDRFAQLDRSRMIPGGELDNGTASVVGREIIFSKWKGTSIRIFGQKAYSYSLFGAANDYSVLLLKN